MRKPSDLNPTQRKSYDLWRDLGLTEAAAMNALVEDGVIRLSEEEKLARSFRETWGLSEAQAEIAVRGRDGGSSPRPVSEASSSWLKPGDNERLISIIEQWRQDLVAHGQLCVERGETRELAALGLYVASDLGVRLFRRSLDGGTWLWRGYVAGYAPSRWVRLNRCSEEQG